MYLFPDVTDRDTLIKVESTNDFNFQTIGTKYVFVKLVDSIQYSLIQSLIQDIWVSGHCYPVTSYGDWNYFDITRCSIYKIERGLS